ncbi:hypothetical protein GYMLUDRAFT_35263 [Collybiopsis luxurians FD-317 M1]|nr:hypothetical protein GYMLUDRAFT_35263 [Collybiopsis luxurians FD-317 M1]
MPSSCFVLLSPIRGHIPLLERLYIRIPCSDFVPKFTGFEIAPALREVVIRPLKDRFMDDIPIPLEQLTTIRCEFPERSLLYSLLTRIPAVSKLRVYRSANNSSNISFPDVSFPELRSLEMERCDIPLLCSLLSRSSNLTSLRIVALEGPETPPEITLPNLRTLVFEGAILTFSFENIIQFLRAPKLTEFKFDSAVKDNGYTGYMDAIKTFFIRSGCELDSFQLVIDKDPASEMAKLLPTMPSLKHLFVSTMQLDHIPFRDMTPVSHVFPKLETLELGTRMRDNIAVLTDLTAFAQSSAALKISFREHRAEPE